MRFGISVSFTTTRHIPSLIQTNPCLCLVSVSASAFASDFFVALRARAAERTALWSSWSSSSASSILILVGLLSALTFFSSRLSRPSAVPPPPSDRPNKRRREVTQPCHQCITQQATAGTFLLFSSKQLIGSRGQRCHESWTEQRRCPPQHFCDLHHQEPGRPLVFNHVTGHGRDSCRRSAPAPFLHREATNTV